MNKHAKYYFIGIGGIGMSALARYFNAMGCAVAGYDKTASVITHSLESEGISVGYDDTESAIPDEFKAVEEDLLVVRTPAVPLDNQILNFFQNGGAQIMKRSQLLAEVASSKKCIAVAGTHGKTTTSSILAHLLYQSPVSCTAFVGGVMPAYNSNVLSSPESPYVVIEADEFDRSFHHLKPELAIITSTDADHLDVYGDEEAFTRAFLDFSERVLPSGKLFYHEQISLFTSSEQRKSYGIESGDVQAKNVRIEKGAFYFDMDIHGLEVKDLTIALPGRHNVLNTMAAVAVAVELGLSPALVKKNLASYQGVKRRFEFVLKQDDLVFIDDYAHHPTEINACIDSVRELFPEKKLTVIFQPHLFTRTRDFLDAFASSLSQADEVLLLNIYPAREKPIPGVTSEALLEKLTVTNKVLCEKEELPRIIEAKEFEVLLTLGAGDIDRLVPSILEGLKSKQN